MYAHAVALNGQVPHVGDDGIVEMAIFFSKWGIPASASIDACGFLY
jgi:hypothetical protein